MKPEDWVCLTCILWKISHFWLLGKLKIYYVWLTDYATFITAHIVQWAYKHLTAPHWDITSWGFPTIYCDTCLTISQSRFLSKFMVIPVYPIVLRPYQRAQDYSQVSITIVIKCNLINQHRYSNNKLIMKMNAPENLKNVKVVVSTECISVNKIFGVIKIISVNSFNTIQVFYRSKNIPFRTTKALQCT